MFRRNFYLVSAARLLAIGLAFPLLCVARQGTASSSRISGPIDENHLVRLRGNVYPQARPENDQGAAPSDLPMNRMLLVLRRAPEQEAALAQFLQAQESKSSPLYHQWLAPAQFGRQFGPSDADIQTISSWLASHGLTVTQVSNGRTVIEFSGTAAQVQDALHTPIHRFRVNGGDYWANTSDPEIPSALQAVVDGVVSLNSFPPRYMSRYLGQFHRAPGQSRIEPLFTFPNPFGSGTFYGVGPGDFAVIYNSKPLIAAGNDGTGQVIAVVGETNLRFQDVQRFRSMFGLPANFDSSNVILNGADPGITSIDEEGEADLDVEWSGAVAPGATVKFVVSGSTYSTAGIDLSALYIVDNDLAGVMSESYGLCEADLGTAGNAFYNSLWEQAAAQGITVVLSSGDGGSAGCDDFNFEARATRGLAVSGLASTPFNVSVGGTDFDQVNNWTSFWNSTNDATGTSAMAYIPEIPWNENCAQISINGCGTGAPQGSLNIVAGSGGPSHLYPKPSWQMGVPGMPNDNSRDQPDVALFASPGFDGSGYIYCQSDYALSARGSCDLNTAAGDDFGIIGGTSASAPAFAGIMALVNQYQAAHGGTNRQGNANYVLYALAKQQGASCTSGTSEPAGCIFNDVTKGNSTLPTGLPGVGTNSVPCQSGSPNCSVDDSRPTGVLVDPANTSTEAWTATAGYDMTTGLGSLNAANLATKWASASTTATTTVLSLSPASGITHGAHENVSVNITVTANMGARVPTGDVALVAEYPDGTLQEIAPFTLVAGTISAATVQRLPGGSYNVVAHYTGDGTDAPSDSNAVPVSVSPESSKVFVSIVTLDVTGRITSHSAGGATYGSGYYFLRTDVGDSAAVVSPASGISSNCSMGISNCPTGSVTFTAGAAPLSGLILPLNSLGYAEFYSLPPGSYSIAANYPGDSSYLPVTLSTNLSIARASTQTSAGVEFPTAPYGYNTGISAGIITSSDGDAPGGTVSFFLDGNPLTVSSGIAYQGYPYSSGGPSPRYASLTASALAQFTHLGSHTLTVQYSGDANYAPSASNPYAFTVGQDQPYFSSFGPTPNAINLNQPVTLSASLEGTPAGFAPTGTFIFYDGNTPISGTITYTTTQPTGTRDSSLMGTLTYTPTVPGVHNITVKYSGDTYFLPADTPVAATLTVIGPDFSFSTSGPIFQSVSAGQTATYTNVLSASSLDGFNSAVSLSCSLPAAHTTCVVTPSSFPAATGTASVTVTTSFGSLLPPTAPGGRSLPPLPILFAGTLLSMLLLICLRLRPSPRLRWLRALSFALFLFCLVLPLVSCGGGSSGSVAPPPPPPPAGTPPGSYVITVTGQSGNLTHRITLMLNVT